MRFFDSFKVAQLGLTVHKTRSVLTVLGIVIGITSIMTVMSVGESAEQLIVGQIQRFGPTNVFVLPGKEPSGPTDAAGTLLNDSLKKKDLEDLQKKSNVPDAVQVIPYVFGLATASYGSETYDGMVIGSTEHAQENFDLEIADGRFFDSYDVDERADVAVLGDGGRKGLFGDTNPLGEKVRFKNRKLTVIGVLAPEGQGSFVDFNTTIVAPYSSVQEKILGVRHFNRMIIEASSIEKIPAVIQDIETTLRENHNIDDPEKDDFWVQTQEGVADQVKSITSILTVLLTSVAAISLIVGGVGIMNIMLVSVTERTREIGLRKALGATNRNVLLQFLLEALFLTAIGGVVGIMLGILTTFGLSYLARTFAGLDFPYVFSLDGIFWGIFVSLSIGLVFGIFPARKAAKKSPIEALRYE